MNKTIRKTRKPIKKNKTKVRRRIYGGYKALDASLIFYPVYEEDEKGALGKFLRFEELLVPIYNLDMSKRFGSVDNMIKLMIENKSLVQKGISPLEHRLRGGIHDNGEDKHETQIVENNPEMQEGEDNPEMQEGQYKPESDVDSSKKREEKSQANVDSSSIKSVVGNLEHEEEKQRKLIEVEVAEKANQLGAEAEKANQAAAEAEKANQLVAEKANQLVAKKAKKPESKPNNNRMSLRARKKSQARGRSGKYEGK